MTEETVVEKTSIRPDTSGYTKAKSASGNVSQHNGDAVASTLVGLTLEETKTLAIEVCDNTDLETKYDHLNPGQQRMNLGNRIRGVVNKMNKAAEADAAKEKPEGLVSGDSYLTTVAEPYRQAADVRAEEAAAAAEAKAAERAKKAEEKAAKEKAKVEAQSRNKKNEKDD